MALLSPAVRAQSKTELPGFAGIAWGSSRNLVKRDFATHGIYRLSSEDEVFAYFEGPYLGRQAELAVGFQKGRMFEVIVSFREEPTRAISDYRDIVKRLVAIFGAPSAASEILEPPFESGDGRELEAILSRKASFSSTWNFGDGNDLTAFIQNADLSTLVIFTDTSLLALYLESLGKR